MVVLAAAAAAASGANDAAADYRDAPANNRVSPHGYGNEAKELRKGLMNIIPGLPSTQIPDVPGSSLGAKLEQDLAEEAAQQSTEDPGHWLVEHIAFKTVITVAVMINAILMGVEVDHPEWEDEWKRIDHFFGALFMIEMLTKWAALRVSYFHDRWNWLDCSLAWMGFMDTWFITIVGGNNIGLSQFSILRILRLLRLVRLVRLFRQFKKLIIVMRSIKDAIETTFWVASVLVICIYVCAIFCVDFIGRAKEGTYPGFSDEVAVINEQEVMANFNPHIVFGSMSAAMCSLFNIAILAEWTEIVRPVLLKQPPLVFFFLAFMCFVCFGVMNVIIGMIVDSTIQHARELERELQHSRKKEKVHLIDQLKGIIFQVDDESGTAEIDKKGLETLLNSQDERMTDIMDKVSLPYGCSPEEFLALLDNDGDGHLKHEEFVQNLYRIVNCSGFQQTCLVQIGINKLMHSVNVLTGVVSDISEHVGLPPSPLLAKKQKSGLGDGVAYSSAVRTPQVGDERKGAAAVPERPELAIRLDAVCQEVSRSIHHKLREELTQSLQKVLLVDDASLLGQWTVMEDTLHKIAVPDPATLKSPDRPPRKDQTMVEDIDINAGQPSTDGAYPFHSPEGDAPALDTPRRLLQEVVDGTDLKIDNKFPHEIAAAKETARKVQREGSDRGL